MTLWKFFRYLLSLFVGLVLGSMVNMGVLLLGFQINPMPEGLDVMNVEAYNKMAHLLKFHHYMTPFFAHAIGTFVGAYLAAKITLDRKMVLAILIGILFMLGGILEVQSRVTPMWFTILDIGIAYIPMAYLGRVLAGEKTVKLLTKYI